MRAAVRRLLWSVPIAVTFTDAVRLVLGSSVGRRGANRRAARSSAAWRVLNTPPPPPPRHSAAGASLPPTFGPSPLITQKQVASVIRVDGASMQPTLNPARGGGEASGSSSGSSGSGASASASSSTAVPSPSPSAASSAAAAPTRSATSSDWVLVDKWSVKVRHRYERGDVVVLW